MALHHAKMTRRLRFCHLWDGKGEGECGSLTRCALDRGCSAVQFGHPPNDCEPQPDPPTTGARRIGSVEPVEQIRQMFCSNTLAGIRNVDADATLRAAPPQRYLSTRRSVCESVGHQIPDGALEQRSIGRDDEIGFNLCNQRDSGLGCCRFEEL